MAKKAMQPSTLLSPVPVVMVTCGDMENPNIITIAWTGIVNSQPPMTYVSVRPERYSHHLIAENGEFVINLTTEELAFATDFCGVKSGREVNKAEEMKLTLEPGELVSSPLIAASPVNLECKVCEVRHFPTHDMFIAEIVRVHGEEDLFDEKGRFCLEKAGLLCYSHGEYFGLQDHPLGKFGYSIMKPKTRKRYQREQAKRKAKAARVEKSAKPERTAKPARSSKAKTAGAAKSARPSKAKTVRAADSGEKRAKKRG